MIKNFTIKKNSLIFVKLTRPGHENLKINFARPKREDSLLMSDEKNKIQQLVIHDNNKIYELCYYCELEFFA